MKFLLTLSCFLFCLPLPAQNYYVALVKGKVYYEDVLLKPRTKIELRGNLRFTTKDDYVKVSGPAGIHTIRPEKKEAGGYEFLRAVTQELFPAAKPRGSFVLSAWSMQGDVLAIYCENEYAPKYFVAGERIPLKRSLKRKQFKRLYWVSKTGDDRLLIEPAKVVKSQLELSTEALASARQADSIVANTAYLFYVSDLDDFSNLADKFALDDLFWATNPDFQPVDGQSSFSDGGSNVASILKVETNSGIEIFQPYPDIIGLGWISPEQVLEREAVMEEMLHYFLASGETSVRTFLLGAQMEEREDYSGLLRERYGEMNYYRVGRAFVDYLYEHRKDSARIKQLWKMNRE